VRRTAVLRRASPLLLVALLAAACSTFGEQPAARVDGVEIATEDVEADIDAIQGNEQYAEFIEGQYGEITGDGTFDSAFAAQLLTLRLYIEIVDQHLEDEGIEVTDEVQQLALANVESQFQGIFEEFPREYRDALVHQQAVVATIEDVVREEVGNDPEAFYEDNPEAFAEVCLAHVLVGLQGGRSPDEAEERAAEIRADIEAGDITFEEAASTQSDDTFAAEQAGDLGCGSQQQLQFDPTFETAAFALEEGELSEPVVTQFGAHLILLTSREVPDYEDVEDVAGAVLEDATERRFNEYLLEVMCAADVEVNSRYGSWTSSSCREVVPTLPRVEPPEGPIVPEEPGVEFEL